MDKDTSASLLFGLGIGAGMMYLMDPNQGDRRRALLRDQATHALHATEDSAGKTVRDMRNRTKGFVAEMQSAMHPEDVSDEVQVARVRATLGRVVSHPGSIEVTANNGEVTLSGPVLDSEKDALLRAVGAVRGVKGIDNRLDVHQKRGDWPGLQGGYGPRPGMEPDFMQENWSPATRAIAGAAGGALALYGSGHKDFTGTMLSALGLGLLARGFTNLEMERLTGVGAGRRAVDLHKTINIHAPVETVYDFFTHFENFPHFMHNVREVSVGGANGEVSHWKVAGPAGITFEWDSVITQREPNRRLAWKSVEGSTVGHAGILHFEENGDGSTRVDIRMSYNPPAGAVGHAVASLLGADAKHMMDADLARVKTFMETGQPAHDAAAPIDEQDREARRFHPEGDGTIRVEKAESTPSSAG
ncbi:MAG: SRPBCC family protein [Armatimonadetes bacterium]|nr:SRPBCC family protein [Armatimonadota bacterium]